MITDNYIKMCEQAEEIQKEWEQTVGDIFIYQKDIKSKCYFYITEHRKYINAIWLPTQEQLVKIHFDWYLQRYKGKMSISEYFLYLHEFALIAEESEYKYYTPKEMMMGYLYQEKYSKEWTGKKWIITN